MRSDAIDAVLAALPDSAAWGACVVDVRARRVLAARDPDATLGTASIGKVLLLVELAERLERDPGWADALLARAGDGVRDSGTWQHLLSERLPVHDLAVLVGAHSDNLATNVLLHEVGLDVVARRAAALGLERTALLDVVRGERGPGDPPHLSTGSAGELAALAARLEHGDDALSPPVARRVVGWLRTGTDLSMVPSALGFDPLAHMEPDRGWELWNKTGTNAGIRADAGVLRRGEDALAYALIANWASGDPRDEVLAAMRAFGLALRQALVG